MHFINGQLCTHDGYLLRRQQRDDDDNGGSRGARRAGELFTGFGLGCIVRNKETKNYILKYDTNTLSRAQKTSASNSKNAAASEIPKRQSEKSAPRT